MHFKYITMNNQSDNNMNFHTRKWVKPEDLNPNETLFGGRLLEWIDEEAALYAIIQLENERVVTKYMSEINFQSSAKKGDIIEIGIEVKNFGKSSITLRCEVRNKMTHSTIITVDNIVFVNLGQDGQPKPHGKTQVEYVKDRLEKRKRE
jgi:acyl-CoA thioesterase YciA